jgi:GT2 family glycosyltransferase
MEALEWYTIGMPNTNILVLDNGNQNIKCSGNVYIWEHYNNMGVARSWNYLIRKAIDKGEENFLVLNDDIILKKSELEIDAMIAMGSPMTFHRPRPFYNWSAFILRKSIFDRVGEFDTNFEKCFFEDNDYEYRMRLKGVNVKYEDGLAPDVYRNSMTIQKDPLLGGYLENREYYLEKWGGLPTEEQYKTPFNK